MKIVLLLPLLLLATCAALHAEPPTVAASDGIKVMDKNVAGLRRNPRSAKPDAIVVNLEVEVVLKTRSNASVRAAANLESENQLTTVYTRSVKSGRRILDISITAERFKRGVLGVVVWIDENPSEEKGALKPLVFEKLAFDVSGL